VSGAAESLFSTLFPSDCRLCGAPLIKISRLPVCDACLSHLTRIAENVCAICGERLAPATTLAPAPTLAPSASADEGIEDIDTAAETRCPACVLAQPNFHKAAAYGSYSGGLRDLIHLLKYHHVRPAANVLGRMLSEVIAELAAGEPAREVLRQLAWPAEAAG